MTSKGPRPSMRFRGWRAWLVGLAATSLTTWLLVRGGMPAVATGIVGIAALTAGCGLGIGGLRRLLSPATGITGVARTVLDEAVRMRAALVLLVLVVLLVPTLPLVLDHSERLHYRIQFVINWVLGGTGLILGALTLVLACGSVCGDIDSNRIHMTLAKPLQRWEYLVGKWLGIVLFDLLLVILTGAGTATFIALLASTEAVDPEDRAAVDGQVLTARMAIQPGHDKPEEYEAAIDAAIRQLEKDDPDAFVGDPETARRRIRQEYDWEWHTVTPDLVSTYVFSGLASAREVPGGTLQLQLKPRAYNVDVDLADVRFALWLNGRPWPLEDGTHVEQQLETLAVHVLDLPADTVDEQGVLRLTVANRNLVPAGETQPTAITFSPGDGLRIMVRVGGFTGNFLRCLAVIWIKLALVAALGVAAATCMGFPMAILASGVVAVAAVGSGFFRDAGGLYNMSSRSLLGSIAERLLATWDLVTQVRLYEAFRMLLGFVTDAILWLIPSFSDYDSVARLATGMAIPWGDVVSCLWWIGLVSPLLVGLAGWLVFDRRDLVRSSS
ncbi:MAG: ABC transporter permease [Pirellulales bacterium]